MTSFSAFGAGILARYARDPDAARAREVEPSTFALSVTYKADVASVLSGGRERGVFLDTLDLRFDADLSRALRWSGATARVHLPNASGAAPDNRAGGDRLRKWLSIQPDFQHVPNLGADGARDAVRAGLVRSNVELN